MSPWVDCQINFQFIYYKDSV